MTLIYSLLCLACVVLGVLVGWYGRGLRLRYAKPRGMLPDADGAVQDTDMPHRDRPTTDVPFAVVADEDDESSPLATGGRISAPGEPDDSVPVLLSEGGYLMYPHGDHSGPTAMDELGDKLNEGGPWMT